MVFVREVRRKSGTYLVKVEGYRVGGKVKQRVIKYLGRKFDCEGSCSVRNVGVESVKRSLDVEVIHKLAGDLGLGSVKNKMILVLVYSHLLGNRSIDSLEDWLGFTEIPEVLGLRGKVTAKRLYECLSDFEDFEEIEHKVFEKLRCYEDEKNAAIIDVTDTYFEGKTLDVKRRKGKDGKTKRLIQIGLAVTLKHGFPIFHKTYHGNLNNIDVFKDMFTKLKSKQISSVVLDRGMISKENLNLILDQNLKTICGMKKTPTLKSKYLTKIQRNSIYRAENLVELANIQVFVKKFSYKNGNLLAIYNPAAEVSKNTLKFKTKEPIDPYSGYTLIYHNTHLNDKEAVKKYYEKDSVEKAFKKIKGVLNLRPLRVWLTEHIQTHIKICHLSYAILTLMNYQLRKQHITANQALKILEQGHKIQLKNKTTKKKHTTLIKLQPQQKQIQQKILN